MDLEGRISFQNVTVDGYHKLPGGGVDSGESIEDAVKREVLEEVGCEMKLGELIGVVIEYKDKLDIIQISYCYFGNVIGEVTEPKYEKDELEKGFVPEWTTIDSAIMQLEKDDPSDYEGRFIKLRDLAFLKEAKKLMS
jgi:ADP-ribose pyrophosphatase YjhB (NUDIX family)